MIPKTFAVIGDPISHSLSPHIHTAAFKELNMSNCSYIAFRIPRGDLQSGIQSLLKIGIAGFNVTIPHKIQMMKYLDKTDESCSLTGAVNTVTNDNGVLRGYNTDMDGFMDPLKSRGIDLANKKVLILGAGGAARAIVAALSISKVGYITIANRTLQNAKGIVRLAKQMGIKSKAIDITYAGDAASESDMIVNATSLGLSKEPVPIPAESINRESVVYDIVYMPMNTDLIKKARSRGATTILGYEMLLGQATRAFEIWHGTDVNAPRAAMKRTLLGGVSSNKGG